MAVKTIHDDSEISKFIKRNGGKNGPNVKYYNSAAKEMARKAANGVRGAARSSKMLSALGGAAANQVKTGVLSLTAKTGRAIGVPLAAGVLGALAIKGTENSVVKDIKSQHDSKSMARHADMINAIREQRPRQQARIAAAKAKEAAEQKAYDKKLKTTDYSKWK